MALKPNSCWKLKSIFFIGILFSSFSFAQELKSVTALSYYDKTPSIERKQILNLVTQQFDSKTVSQKQLDQLWHDKYLRKQLKLTRFQIINQKLYADSFDITHLYFVVLTQYFENLVKKYHISDIDFIVHASDEISISNSYIDQFPSFMMSKDLASPQEKEKFLIPDAHMVKANWGKLIKRIEKAKTENNWLSKSDKIFWRGNSSGSKDGYQIENLNKIARLKLVFLSKLFPNILDARLTGGIKVFNQGSQKLDQLLNILFKEDFKTVSEEEHLKYKYLISVDGYTCAWMRVPWIMFSNSVLVKQETSKIEWFYPALKAYHNYVPVNFDLSDIFKQYEWLQKHQKEAIEISNNAQDFIAKNLMPEDIDMQMVITLNEYAKIQQDKNILPTLTPYKDVFSITAVINNLSQRLLNWIVWWFI
jgi:hypothetical protein